MIDPRGLAIYVMGDMLGIFSGIVNNPISPIVTTIGLFTKY